MSFTYLLVRSGVLRGLIGIAMVGALMISPAASPPAGAHNLGAVVWDSGSANCGTGGYGLVKSYQQGDNKHFFGHWTVSVTHNHGYRTTVHPWSTGSNTWSAWGADLIASLTNGSCFT